MAEGGRLGGVLMRTTPSVSGCLQKSSPGSAAHKRLHVHGVATHDGAPASSSCCGAGALLCLMRNERAAAHEAGHAVGCLVLGMPIVSVQVLPAVICFVAATNRATIAPPNVSASWRFVAAKEKSCSIPLPPMVTATASI
jgi:hypothetical protein